MLEQSNNDDDNKEDDLSANADDVTVPHSNSIEHIDGGGDGGEDDFQLPDEPIITTSFGSNSVEDELNQLQDVSTDVMVDHRGVSGVDEGVEGSASNNDEDDVVSVESESASHVTSDFTLGGYMQLLRWLHSEEMSTRALLVAAPSMVPFLPSI